MRYQIKKSLFFLLVILSILLLLYWILYDLGEAFYGIVKLQTTLDIRWLFRGDAIISLLYIQLFYSLSHLLSI